MNKFFDKYKILHHKDTGPERNPETSENGPLFTGLYLSERSFPWRREDALGVVQVLWDGDSGIWRTTPGSSSKRFSRDNFTGLICLLESFRHKYPISYKYYFKQLPLFHRQLKHPRDFILVGYYKYPYLFWPLLPIAWVALFVSCWQTYKYRNGRKIVKSEGKLMAKAWCWIFGWETSREIFLKAVTRKRKIRSDIPPASVFNSWGDVYREYFREEGHPLRSID